MYWGWAEAVPALRRAAARRRRANPLSLMPRRLVVALVSMLLCELRSVDVEAQSAGEPPLAASVPQAAPPAPAQPPAAKVAPKAAPPKAAPVAAKPADPNLQLYTSLIRSTLVAFNQANMTGQYNVLYALAAPEFQAQNSAAKLEQSFAPFKNQKIDLTPVTVLSPQLVNPPGFDAQKNLRLVGFFPTQPLQVRFDLAFKQVDGGWRFTGLAVAATPQVQAQPKAKPPAPSAGLGGSGVPAKAAVPQTANR